MTLLEGHNKTPMRTQVLLRAGIASADTVVLGGLQAARSGDWHSDARVLTSLLQVCGGGARRAAAGRVRHQLCGHACVCVCVCL